MKRNVSSPGLLIGIVLLAGCMRTAVQTNFDCGFNFAAPRTYAWRPVNRLNGETLPADARLNSRVKAAVGRTLDAKGYHQVAPDQADLWIGFDVSTQEKLNVADTEKAWDPGFWKPTYTWATLGLVFLRPGSVKPVWHATVHEDVHLTQTLQERNQLLKEDVEYLLKKFPPKNNARRWVKGPGSANTICEEND